MYAELHCHTMYSIDGAWQPEALVDAAAAQGVSVLAVTDHNSIGALPRAQIRARERGLRFLTGVELNATLNGQIIDMVALGFDPRNEALNQLVESNRSRYTIKYDRYIQQLARMGRTFTPEQLAHHLATRYPTHPSQVRNTYVLQAMLETSMTRDDAITLMRQVGKELETEPDTTPPWPDAKRTSELVHNAGGIVVLAHVAKYHRGDLQKQLDLIDAAMAHGMDGFELRHHANLADSTFPALQAKAMELDCVITGGTDTHAPIEGDYPANRSPRAMQIPASILEKIDTAIQAVRHASRAR